MLGFWNQDEELEAVEREFKRLRARYYKASRKLNSTRGSENYNERVCSISAYNAAEADLRPVLQQYNMMREQRGMKPALVYGINAWR